MSSKKEVVFHESDIPPEMLCYFEEVNTPPTVPAVVFDPFLRHGHGSRRGGQAGA